MAKQVTGDQNETEAVKKFKKILSSPDNFYNKEDFPANESDEQAHRRCRSVEGAKKYCPVRWKALQSWFRDARIVRSFIFLSHFTRVLKLPGRDHMGRSPLRKNENDHRSFQQ